MTFRDWWFLNGGSIHGLWKGRKFSKIRDLALSLPKMAWDARQPEVDGLKSEIASLREALEKIYSYRSDKPDWNMVMAIAGDIVEPMEAAPSSGEKSACKDTEVRSDGD